MPRSKPRKSTKGQFSPEDMKEALLMVRNGCKQKTAANAKNLAYSTFKRYLAKTKDVEDLDTVKLSPTYNTKQVFPSNLELNLAEYILECSKLGYGLTALEIRKFAYEYAMANESSGLKTPETWHLNQQAGEDWFCGFMKRHKNLSARKPEQCTVARAMAFNKENIMNYFKKLEEVLQRQPSFANGSRVFNLDETGTTSVGEIKRIKVIGEKGCKQLHQIKSAERGVLVTTCCIICANGSLVPPVMVFPRVNFNNSMIINAYPGTKGLATKRGWMNSEIFLEVLQHFVKKTNSSIASPTLLIVDNVNCHLSILAIDLCRENGVTLLTLPPHTTHKTQPLDVGVFGPFHTAYNRAYHNWTLNHPGEVCSIYHIAGLVNEALCKAATPANIFAAFKATGIYPFNKDVFSDLDFVPSRVTENLPPPCAQVKLVETRNEVQEAEQEDDPSPITNAPDYVTPRKIRPLPKAKPKDLTRKPREKGKCRVATDSAEKKDIQEKHEAKKSKEEEQEKRREVRAAKNLEKLLALSAMAGKGGGQDKLRNKLPSTSGAKRNASASKEKHAKRARKLEPPSECTSEAEEILSICSSKSDDLGEGDDNSDEEIDDGDDSEACEFEPLTRSPEEGEHVLVHFQGQDKFYVAKVLAPEDCDGDLEVSYYRISSKVSHKFVLPNISDLKSVHISCIKKILPKPKHGATARQKNLISFDYSFANLRMG